MRARLVIMAKSPAPGRVKTRLTPPLSPEQAAAVAQAALQDTLRDAVVASGRTPPLLALAGPAGPWLPDGVEVVPQEGDGLDERIGAALVRASGPALVIGMDTPHAGPELLRNAIRLTGRRRTDAVLGLAADGGWWALGMREPDPEAVRGVPMSTPWTGRAQRRRLDALGLRTAELPLLRDVDTFEDALAVARLAPRGSFARAVDDVAMDVAADRRGGRRPMLRCADGEVLPLRLDRWLGDAEPEEHLLLTRASPPVLDIGCGPGRHVASLLGSGIPAMGIDPAPSAVRLARDRGAVVLQRSVFDALPRTGRWGSALLLDGNVGIGGDPRRLLCRVAALLRPGGAVLMEVEGPGLGVHRTLVRLDTVAGLGPWFEWARVGAGAVPRLASESGLVVRELWHAGGRWFARLVRPSWWTEGERR